VNCAKVWNTEFANRVHEFFHMPIAGLGVVWAGAAILLAAGVFLMARRGDAGALRNAAKLWSWAGLLSIVAFATASMRAGAVCPTCLTTYVLVGVYAFGALKLLPGGAWPKSNELGPAAGWAIAAGALLFIFALPKGLATPSVTTVKLDASNLGELSKAFDGMSQQDLLMASVARAQFQLNTAADSAPYPTRMRLGPANAPVALTEWSDILCGHCRHLEETFEDILKRVPPTAVSIEPRYFPLDGECNPSVTKVQGDGIRCLAAKVQLCLEGTPQYWPVRRAMFANQEQLSTDTILEIARNHGVDDTNLRVCVESPDTQKKLEDDIAYANEYAIDGTPLLLVNGKMTLPSGPFLMALILAKGDANAPIFQKLPPPPPLQRQ